MDTLQIIFIYDSQFNLIIVQLRPERGENLTKDTQPVLGQN